MRLDTRRLQTLEQVREFLAGSAGIAGPVHGEAAQHRIVRLEVDWTMVRVMAVSAAAATVSYA